MPKLVVLACSLMAVAITAAPAAGATGRAVSGSGYFVLTAGAAPNYLNVVFECNAVGLYDAASTAVDDCRIEGPNVIDAGNCSLSLPGPVTTVPCVGRIATGSLRGIPDTARQAYRVCWQVHATFITNTSLVLNSGGCSLGTPLAGAGAGATLE